MNITVLGGNEQGFMTDIGEKASAAELAFHSLESTCFDNIKYLDHFYYLFLVQREKLQRQFFIVVVCGGSLPAK